MNERKGLDIKQKLCLPTFIDVFAGCGGLSLGLMLSGWRGLFAVEKEENAFSTLSYNLLSQGKPVKFDWPDWLPKKRIDLQSLILQYNPQLKQLSGKIDLLVGGPPCQGFSTAGRRDPNDPRNALVKDYLRFVDIIQPSIVLIENVCGITADFDDSSAPDGKLNYSKWIKTELSRNYTVYSQTIDTSLFGVPQRRKRFFVIAVKKEIKAACPFEAIDNGRLQFLKNKFLPYVPVAARAAISDLEVSRNGKIPSSDSKGFEQIAYRGPLTKYQKLMNRKSSSNAMGDTRLAHHKPHIVERFKKLIALCQSEGRLNTSLSAELRASLGLRKCAIRVMDPDKPAPTITSLPDDLLHYTEPRTLTVRENARLQTFPDWFMFKGKYTTGGDRRRKEVPRFTQVANAVPPLLAEAIGTALQPFYLAGKS